MWKKILGTVVVLIVLFIAVIMYATSGMTDVANTFFTHAKTKHYNDAYNMLSEDFKKSVSEEQLKNFLEKNALTEYKSASWNNRSFEGNMGKLEGSIATQSGSVIPLTIEFVKNTDGQWQIYSIYKRAGGIGTEQTTDTSKKVQQVQPSVSGQKKTLPSDKEIKALVQESVMVFANSVNDKSMKKLYEYSADVWKKQTSIKQLDKIFDSFYKAGLDLTVLKDIVPQLDQKPEVGKYGEITVKGHYPTSPAVVYFENSYFPENGKWKLVGIDIQVHR
ncbi:hypothetical protein [Sulfurovum sp.]|uniref:hypothetical protein n=1 Tax=Sulfurovum sp. TaxID=1969726 RepID=UPI0025D0A987|nr:hypothetical protein [Sulfurovum sp.]